MNNQDIYTNNTATELNELFNTEEIKYYLFIENDLINGRGNCKRIEEYIINLEVSKEVYDSYEKYIYQDNELVVNPNYETEQEAKEQERIQELYMSKSDFFDGTIKAFGADKNDLLPAIDAILKTLPIDNIEKKVALNNFENAQNYYRKHSLFTLLSDVEIPINETLTIKISSKQWDNFFDETSKGNKEAYKELIT